MEYIITAVIGLIAGALAKFLMPGDDPGGFIITMLLGIAGSFVGKYVGALLGVTFLNGFFGAVAGAILLLIIWRFVSTKILK